MNNNSILIDRYLQNEMSAEERTAFENQLTTDKSLQEELQIQQQIIKAATTAGLKAEFGKAIRKRIITKRLLQWGIVIIIVAAAVTFFMLQNNHAASEKNRAGEDKAAEKFEFDNNADTIIETKDGVVFAIPAHAFNTNNNIVQLEIKTALNAADIIKNGLSTMSNDALLQTAGMFYINGFVDGKAVSLAKDISVSVPAENINPDMELFDGVEDTSGRINWVNPKPIDKSLHTYDITTLDFYPPKYIPTVKALGKDYQNKIYTDSLYYSFSGLIKSEEIAADAELGGNGDVSDYPAIESDTFKIPRDQHSSNVVSDSFTFSFYQIDPAMIRAIWDKKFNNTILATKEFEERLRYMHTQCTDEYLKIYLRNLNKPLYVSDELCAKAFKGESDAYNKFKEFAARKDGGVMLQSGMQQKLSIYFQQKYKAYKDAAAKTWAKYQHTFDSLNNIADYKKREQSISDFTRQNKNFREELCINLTDAYRQIGKEHDCNENLQPPAKRYYNVYINSTGWKNLDAYVIDATINRQNMTYTDPATGKTAKLTYSGVSFKIENIIQFDKVLVYLIPDSLSSFQRVKESGDIFKEQLNALFKYDVIALAYKGTQAYYFNGQNIEPKEYLLSLAPVTDTALRIAVNKYSVSKTTALITDFEYQLFEQQETIRQVQLQKDVEFRQKIAQSIFNCLAPANTAPAPALPNKK